MGDVFLAEQSVPSTPSSGNGIIFIDSTASILCFKDDAGRVWAESKNAATASQGAGFATDTYVTNSDLLIPSFGLQAKTQFVWRISASKSAAGTVTPTYTIRFGTNRSTADTSRLALVGPSQTAAGDIGVLNIMLTVRSIGATGVIQGTAWWSHRGTAASSTIGIGFANDGNGIVEGTSAGFDMTTLAGSYIGLSINASTSAAWTVTQVQSEAAW